MMQSHWSQRRWILPLHLNPHSMAQTSDEVHSGQELTRKGRNFGQSQFPGLGRYPDFFMEYCGVCSRSGALCRTLMYR